MLSPSRSWSPVEPGGGRSSRSGAAAQRRWRARRRRAATRAALPSSRRRRLARQKRRADAEAADAEVPPRASMCSENRGITTFDTPRVLHSQGRALNT
eukprot:s2032_g12.t1